MLFYFFKIDIVWGVVGIYGVWNFVQGNFFGILVSGQLLGMFLMIFLL